MKPTTAKDLMTPTVLSVPPDLDVHELATFFIEHEISGAPVEDVDGKLVGIVSLSDLAYATSEEVQVEIDRTDPNYWLREFDDSLSAEEAVRTFHFANSGLTVRDIMSSRVVTVDEEAPVAELAESMVDGHLHRLLVVRGEKVVGIVSTMDLLGLLIAPRKARARRRAGVPVRRTAAVRAAAGS